MAESRLNVIIDPKGARTGASEVNRALGSMRSNASRALNAMRSGFSKLRSVLFNFKTLIAGIGGGLLIKSFIDAAATTEQFQVRLQVLLGSMKEGKALFRDMADFASRVPFEFENIMEAATSLAGVLEGGRKEIARYMPLIGDLAAASGLDIKTVTEQVIRMFSAGAGAADLFRERGILAMLGFQSGVSYTAEETKKILIQAWEEPASKFRGATDLLAKTWAGGMSMLKDKWFAFRNDIMEGGLFNYLKALTGVINKELVGAMGNSKEAGKKLATTLINGFENVTIAAAGAVDKIEGMFSGITGIIEKTENFFTAWSGGGELIGAAIAEIQNGALKLSDVLAMTPEELGKALADLNVKIDGYDAAIGKLSPRQIAWQKKLQEIRKEFKELQNGLDGTSSKVETFRKGAAEAADSTKTWSQAMRKLNNELFQPEIQESKAFDDYANKLNMLAQMYGTTSEKYQEAVDRLTEKYLQLENVASGSTARAKAEIGDMRDVFVEKMDDMEMAVRGWGNDFTNKLTDVVMIGKANFSDLANSIIRDMIRMYIQAQITLPLMKAISAYAGTAGTAFRYDTNMGSQQTQMLAQQDAGLYHGGGIVGSDSPASRRLFPAGLFASAQRFHSGLLPNEFPAVLQKGEAVLTPGQLRAVAGAGKTNVTINVIEGRGTQVEVQQGQDENGDLTIDIITESIEARMGRNIQRGDGLAPVLESTYNLNRGQRALR